MYSTIHAPERRKEHTELSRKEFTKKYGYCEKHPNKRLLTILKRVENGIACSFSDKIPKGEPIGSYPNARYKAYLIHKPQTERTGGARTQFYRFCGTCHKEYKAFVKKWNSEHE